MKRLLSYFPMAVMIMIIYTGCGTLADRVKTHIETVGSELTATTVDIEELNLGLARGVGEIKGLKIANPEGYQSPYAMEMDLIHLNLGIISTIAGNPLVLDKLVISYPRVNYEKKGEGISNFQELADNARKNEQKANQVSAEEETASEETPGEPVRIAVRHLVIEGVTLDVLNVDGTYRSATLPRIELTDIGGKEGKKPGGLGLVVIGAMTRELARQAIARELIERAGDIRQALSPESLTELVGERLELSRNNRELIKPAATELGRLLLATIDQWTAQGYIDYKAFSEQLSPAIVKLEKKLEEILSGERAERVRLLMQEIEDNGFEILRYFAVNLISEKLDLNPDQLREIRPVLMKHLAKLNELIDLYTDGDQDLSLKDFEVDYRELAGLLKDRLADRLSEKQKAKLAEMLDIVMEKLQTIVAHQSRLSAGK